MFNFPMGVRLYLALQATDLRKSFTGLSMLVQHHFGLDAMSGDLFVFLNRRANQVRILFWERDGFCIVSKRLEEGTFRRNASGSDGTSHVEIDPADLALLLEGVEVRKVRRSRRYRPPRRET